jgi:hypothetical protein
MMHRIHDRADSRNKIHIITTTFQPAAATSEGGRAN